MKHCIDITIAICCLICIIFGTGIYAYVLVNMKKLASRQQNGWMSSLGAVWLVTFVNRDEDQAHKSMMIGNFIYLALIALCIWLDMPYSAAGLLGQVALGLIVMIPALDIGKRGRREFPELVYNG